MKKTLCLLISLLLLASCSVVCAGAAGAGTSFPIVVPENATAGEKYAAGVLTKYLSQITGGDFPTVTGSAGSGFFIALRETDTTDASPAGSYRISSTGGGIEIAGSGPRGIDYGAYAFLEKYCSCHWYTSTLIVTPKADTLSFPDDIDVSYTPYFESTETDWLSPHDAEYSLANGLSGGTYRKLTAEQGGTVNYISGFCHTLTTEFCPAKDFFDSHPEYFALHDGKRDKSQLCLTNPDVYNIVLGEVMDLLKEKHDPDAALQILSLTQNDNQNYCECDVCKALDEANGSHSGTVITFVNKIAEAVKAAGYDNVAIDTFAYQYTRQAPTAVVPDDNVIVRLCSIECCFSHPLDDTSCEQNAAFLKDLTDWSKICHRLYVWDYVTNFARTWAPFPNFGVLQENIRCFYEHGVKGIYEEGNYYMKACDTEFGELRAYLLSKFMQDPYADADSLMNSFLEAYYGPGWQNIREYLDIETEAAAKEHLTIFQDTDKILTTLTDDDIAHIDTLWDNALSAASDSTQTANIRRSQLSWRFWKNCNQKSEYAGFFSRIAARTKFISDLRKSGVTSFSEGNMNISYIAPLMFIRPDRWFGKKQNVLTTPIYALYVISTALAVVIFIMALKKKHRALAAVLPLFAADVYMIGWHNRAYTAWKDMFGYGFTLAFIGIAFAVFFLICRYSAGGFTKRPVKRRLHDFVLGLVIFYVPFEGVVMTWNNIIHHGTANQMAVNMGICLMLLGISVMFIYMIVKLAKKPALPKAGDGGETDASPVTPASAPAAKDDKPAANSNTPAAADNAPAPEGGGMK